MSAPLNPDCDKYMVFLIAFHKPDRLSDDGFVEAMADYISTLFTAQPAPGPVTITPLPAPTPEVFNAIERALEAQDTHTFIVTGTPGTTYSA